MTIAEAQQAVDNWIKENGIRYFNELTNMAILTEEVGEVARGEENLMPAIREAVLAYATVGEITGALKQVFGEYQPPSRF